MKKILLGLVFILFCGYITNAQIKVVGDDYKDSLSGAKNYYDRDISFDTLFPVIDFKTKFKVLNAWTNDRSAYFKYGVYYNYSLIGDTFFIPQDIPLTQQSWNGTMTFSSRSFVVRHIADTEIVLDTVPSGYYTITGYVFCNGGELHKKYKGGSGSLPGEWKYSDCCWMTDEQRLKSAKECFMENEHQLREGEISQCLSYDYVILSSIEEGKDVFYCRGLNAKAIESNSNDRGFRLFNVKYYNEFQKYFIGKYVSIIENSHEVRYRFDDDEGKLNFEHTYVKNGYVFTDAIRKEKFKILDSIFMVKDILIKGGNTYCILEGKNTGSFAIEIDQLKYYTTVYGEYGSDVLFTIDHLDRPYAFSSKYILVSPENHTTIKGEIQNQCQLIIREKQEYQRKQQIREDNLRKQKEKEYRDRKAQEEAAFRKKMIDNYGLDKGTLIANHQISVGMIKDMVKDAWGRPMNTYRTTTSYGQSEVWCYNYKTRVYFYNGKVVQIDD